MFILCNPAQSRNTLHVMAEHDTRGGHMFGLCLEGVMNFYFNPVAIGYH